MTNREFFYNKLGTSLFASVIPGDSRIFGFPVVQIDKIIINDEKQQQEGYDKFKTWRDSIGAKIVTCRLHENKLRESFFLEKNNFNFIEMILHPVMVNIKDMALSDKDLIIKKATKKDTSTIKDIAKRSFRYERFHIDPRLNPELGDVRYGEWVSSNLGTNQQLLKISNNKDIISFFIIERKSSKEVYWHLTAVAPEFQGQGYGKRVWRAILDYHVKQGITTVRTSISARNIPVLNLYSRLGFRFLPPEMTFHWVK